MSCPEKMFEYLCYEPELNEIMEWLLDRKLPNVHNRTWLNDVANVCIRGVKIRYLKIEKSRLYWSADVKTTSWKLVYEVAENCPLVNPVALRCRDGESPKVVCRDLVEWVVKFNKGLGADVD